MVTSTSHKINVDMPAGIERGMTGAARPRFTGAETNTDGVLAARRMR
jgi:hypothetical protein